MGVLKTHDGRIHLLILRCQVRIFDRIYRVYSEFFFTAKAAKITQRSQRHCFRFLTGFALLCFSLAEAQRRKGLQGGGHKSRQRVQVKAVAVCAPTGETTRCKSGGNPPHSILQYNPQVTCAPLAWPAIGKPGKPMASGYTLRRAAPSGDNTAREMSNVEIRPL